MCSDLDHLTDDEFMDRMIEQRKREKAEQPRSAYWATRRAAFKRREETRVRVQTKELEGTPHGVVPACFFKPDWWDK